MKSPGNRWRHILLVLLLSAMLFGTAFADDGQLRRALVGVKVFAAFVAADQDIQQKQDATGKLPLLLIYSSDREGAENLAQRLRGLRAVRGIPVTVRVIAAETLGSYQGPPPAGIFITEWLPDLRPLIAFARHTHSILFSPVLGDMARGAFGGLYVSDRILPYVNLPALKAAGIDIKPFFLDVARHYEAE